MRVGAAQAGELAALPLPRGEFFGGRGMPVVERRRSVEWPSIASRSVLAADVSSSTVQTSAGSDLGGNASDSEAAESGAGSSARASSSDGGRSMASSAMAASAFARAAVVLAASGVLGDIEPLRCVAETSFDRAPCLLKSNAQIVETPEQFHNFANVRLYPLVRVARQDRKAAPRRVPWNAPQLRSKGGQ
eukprot:415414-Prorocentrum_minimum.AAC.6